MTEHTSAKDADEGDRRALRIAYGTGAVKIVFIVALLRFFAGPMTKDLLNDELLPMPTWEWSLFALTPAILIFVARRPRDWDGLADSLTFIRWILGFYLVYALVFATFQGKWVLWIAVLASLGSLAGMWHLNRRERVHAD
ncbi:hypothetical protein AB0945_25420 [Streptomyces sp. NPDC005474]|uniref:hypothetical protein n=1 Tax=Streptomyces sp. NPDC005474 TaxID=3154878 RepID=UPI0034553525